MSASAAESNTLRVLLIALGAVVALAALWFLVAQPLLFPTDDAATPTPPVAQPGDDAPPADAPADQPQVDEVVPIVTYEVFLARDPFEPVREPATPVAPDPGDATPPTATPPTDPTQPPPANGEPPPPANGLPPTNGGTFQGCHGEEEVVCDGRVVTLLDITQQDGRRVAVIQVDETVYTVAQGDVFADHFFLRLIEDDSVIIVYGDGHRIHLYERSTGMK